MILVRIVSAFVREQQRYTKRQLQTIFDCDSESINGFIRKLKTYGIVKAVANSKEQMERSELADEEIQVSDETAGEDDCFFVFVYVGVVVIGNRIIKVYPKYILAKHDPLDEMKQVIKVLGRYSHSTDQIVNLYHGDGDERSFNMLAVILFLLDDYFEYGIYSNSEDLIEINGEGDILWNKTIDEGFAIVEGRRPYYIEMFTHRSVEDDLDYFTRLHECVLTECSRQLRDAGLEDLFDMPSVELTDEPRDSFGDLDYILDRLQAELNVQFNTRRQILLKTIYVYLSQDQKMMDDPKGVHFFGTTAFNLVWEDVCAKVFNNQLDKPIGEVIEPVLPPYNPGMRLIDIIEKPKWKAPGMPSPKEAKETLIPDIVTIYKDGDKKCFIILDAKYYLLQLETDKPLKGNPGVGDVTKQYLYQLAYKDFISKHSIGDIKNCFLMPTEGDAIVNKGNVGMNMLSSLGLEEVKIRFLPAHLVYEMYLSSKTIDIGLLEL